MNKDFWNKDITNEVLTSLAMFGLVVSSVVATSGVAVLGVQAQLALANMGPSNAQAAAVGMSTSNGLTDAQIQAVLNLLAAFNVDEATINNVDGILHGQSNKPTDTGVSISDSKVPVSTGKNCPNYTGASCKAGFVLTWKGFDNAGCANAPVCTYTPTAPTSNPATTATPTQAQLCPAGYVGTYPNCVAPQPAIVTNSVPKSWSNVLTKVLPTIGGSALATDFMVQDVCVNSNDQPIQGDPATCARHRDLKFGEFIPYFRMTAPLNKASVEVDSAPIQASDGTLLIRNTFEHGGVLPGNAFRDFEGDGHSADTAAASADGLSIGEVNGENIALIMTQDGDQGFQPFWRPGCVSDDTWMLFPTNLVKGTNGTIQYDMEIAATCPTTFGGAFSRWEYFAQPFTYESGKTLETIKQITVQSSDHVHFTGGVVGHLEIGYYTREYGETRWEAWFSDTSADQYIDQGCKGPDHFDFGYGPMHRKYCSDITYVTPLDISFNPLTLPFGGSFNFSRNLLNRGDFAQNDFGAWQSWHNPQTDWEIVRDPTTHNYSLVFACWVGCTDTRLGSIYQDVNASSLSGTVTLRAGSIMKSESAARATIAIFLIDSAGNAIHQENVVQTAALSTSWQHYDGYFTWDFSAHPVANIRYQVYIPDSNTRYYIDEAYLTPSR